MPWRNTPQYAAVEYRRIEVNSWRLVILPSEWPADLRWIVEEFRKTEAGRNHESKWSPRFYVVQDHKLLRTAAGFGGWDNEIQPLLKRITGV